MTEIKAVFFDLDDTLFGSTRLAEKARTQACKEMAKAGLKTHWKHAYSNLSKIVLKYGSNYPYHFLELCKAYNIDRETCNKLTAAGIFAYHSTKANHLKPFPDAIKTFKKLKHKKIKLAIITNGRAVKQWDKIIRLGFLPYFDKVYISDREGQSVSKEKLARKAMKELNSKPGQTAWVGDRIDTDIHTANKLGIRSVRFMHGKYKYMIPKNELEKPKFCIKNLSELFTKNIL